MHMLQSHNQEAQQKIQVNGEKKSHLETWLLLMLFMLGESKTEAACYWKIC